MASPPGPVSYATAAAKPPLDTTPEPGVSYADVVEKPIEAPPGVGKRDPTTEELEEMAEDAREERRRRLEAKKDEHEERMKEEREEEEDEAREKERKLVGKEDRKRRRRERREREKVEKEGEKDVSEEEKRRLEGKADNRPPAKSHEDRKKSDEKQHSSKQGVTTLIHGKEVTWAPLNIPLPRRLQTAAVLWHTLAISIFFGLFWFTLAIPLTWPILLPYLLYIIFFATAHEDGSAPFKRSALLRSLPLWRAYASYFPLRLHRTVELPPTENYIFAYHPHGIISHGAFGNFATDATGFSTLFPGITNTLLTLDSNFRIPFYREYLLSLGLASVSRRSCEALLRGTHPTPSLLNPLSYLTSPPPAPATAGRAITIVVGGARESLEAKPGTMNLIVRRRRGFLKLAMRENAAVVPVLGFGENDLYDQTRVDAGSWVHALQMGVKRAFGFTLPLAHARGVFNYDVGLMPYRRRVDVVVGRPLKWARAKAAEVEEREVDEFQKRYVQELERMWEENKERFAQGRVRGAEGELRIVE